MNIDISVDILKGYNYMKFSREKNIRLNMLKDRYINFRQTRLNNNILEELKSEIILEEPKSDLSNNNLEKQSNKYNIVRKGLIVQK